MSSSVSRVKSVSVESVMGFETNFTDCDCDFHGTFFSGNRHQLGQKIKLKQVSKCDFNIETDLPPGLTKARPVQSFDFLIPQEEPPVRYEEDLHTVSRNDETNPVGRFAIASRRVVPRGLCL